ncbi:MAG: hypothetical protein AB1486_18040 [Planctomycetota bacterium]
MERMTAAYRVTQATSEEIGWIAALEASVYSRHDAVPESVLREWYTCNPTGFSVVTAHGGTPVGHIDILPLRPVPLQEFLDGHILERELRGDSLYRNQERASIRHVYVESVILRPPEGRSPAAVMLALLSWIGEIFERVADLRSLEAIYAIAATVRGDQLLRKLGFELLRPGSSRRDGHDLFVGRPLFVARRLQAIVGEAVFDERTLGELLRAQPRRAP